MSFGGGRGVRALSVQAMPSDAFGRVEFMLRTMARHVREAIADESFRSWALKVTSEGRSTDPATRARKALAFVQSLHYVWDPPGIERLQKPAATVKLRAGDCNSLSVLYAAIIGAAGIRARFIVTKESQGDPEWAHVYVEVQLGDYWVSADPSPIGQGRRARYLPLGRAPIHPVEPVYLDAADPEGQLHGFFDSIKDAIGDVLEGARDIVKDVVTLKHLRKGLRWAWKNMPSDLRKLVMKVGPIVAGMYGGPFAKQGAELALGLLEQDRHSREERRKFKRQLKELIQHYEAQGMLEKGAIDVDNPEHLEAIVLAGNMPPAEQLAWFRSRGLAPPAALLAAEGNGAKALLPAAAILLLPVSWPLALVAGVAAVVTNKGAA